MKLAHPIAPPIPFPIAFRHECVNDSGIAPPLYEAALQIVEDSGFWEPNYILNQRVSTQWQTRRPHGYGAIALFINEDRSPWQAKPQHPRPNKGKYEYPVGQGATAYRPPVDVQTWSRIAKRYGLQGFLPSWVKQAIASGAELISHTESRLSSESYSACATALREMGAIPPKTAPAAVPQLSPCWANRGGVPMETSSFWQWVELMPLPVVVTEGGKKALGLMSQGYVAIALLGVNSGVLKTERIGGEKIRRLHPELVPGLAEVAQPGRTFILAFDEDEKPKTRLNVARAQADLGFWLSQAGCAVAIAQWQPSDGKGIDDFIVRRGSDSLHQVIHSAQPWMQWQVQHAVRHRLNRRPNLHLGPNEFQTHVDQLPQSGVVALHGGKGTGKGKAIAQLLRHRSWLSITTLRSLAKDQAASWGGVVVNQGDRHGDTLLSQGDRCLGGVVCVPSLLKTKGLRAEVLVLDELPAILAFLLSSPLANKHGSRPLLLEELEHRIQTAQLVICASADLSDAALGWVESIRGEQAFLVRSERQPLAYDVHLMEGRKHQAIAQFLQHVQSLPPDALTLFHSDSKREADNVAALLLQHDIPALLITADTSGGPVESHFLASKGRDIPALVASGIRAIITSPSVKEGFSIEHHTDQIDSVWGVFEGCSIAPEAIAQTCDRVRALTPRYLWIAAKGRAYSKFSRAESTATFLNDFRRSSNFLARITRRSLLTETELKIQGLDWDSPTLKLLANLEVSRNRGMRALKTYVVALLEAEGKRVRPMAIAIPKNQAQSVRTTLKTIRSRLALEHAIALEQRSPLPDAQAQALMLKDNLTPDEKLDLEHYWLQQFYQTSITRDVVLWDNNGKLRAKIRNLEAVLHPDKAETASAASINQTPTTPQDWNPAKMRQYIIDLSGAANLIRDIVAGTVQELTADRITPIAQWLKQYANDVAIAFNFRNVQKVSDRQAVFLLLDHCGIRRTYNRHRVNGVPQRRYFVDAEHLEQLKATMKRRSEVDPPPQSIDLDQRGDTAQNPSSIPPQSPPPGSELPHSEEPPTPRPEIRDPH